MIVRIEHARRIPGANGKGYCSRGMRLFFAKHGLSYSDFISNGIDAELLIATGDEMALAVVKEAEKDGR